MSLYAFKKTWCAESSGASGTASQVMEELLNGSLQLKSFSTGCKKQQYECYGSVAERKSWTTGVDRKIEFTIVK
ncbi:hypothetical protein [Moorella sulfitireducens (nom. illeg.)]|uniref:hypothetical protein n=1 Tax=Neomoorella sulfitireducens TaxID=2972948 RepID=UPI0021AD2926|nr:hypothetical protein [Moorella sulfitireducens]